MPPNGASFGGGVGDEIQHGAHPESRRRPGATASRGPETIVEQVGHVVAEPHAEPGGKEMEQQAVQTHRVQLFDLSNRRARASRTTSSSLAASAAATRRPNGVMR